MAKEKKEYDVPQELQDIMAESFAMAKLRDALIKVPFRFKKAKQCAIASETLRNEFWREVRILYPELRNEALKVKDLEIITIIDE